MHLFVWCSKLRRPERRRTTSKKVASSSRTLRPSMCALLAMKYTRHILKTQPKLYIPSSPNIDLIIYPKFSKHWSYTVKQSKKVASSSRTLRPSMCALVGELFWLWNIQDTFWKPNMICMYVLEQKLYQRFKKITWIQSHHLHLQWKFKLLAETFIWDNKAKHCWVMSTNFLFSKLFYQ